MAVLNFSVARAVDAPATPARAQTWRFSDASFSDAAARVRACDALKGAVLAAPSQAPLLFMIHGYRYDPNDRQGDPRRDPHQAVLRAEPSAGRCSAPSWPATLGFSGALDTGLAIAVGWSSLPAIRDRRAGALNPLAWAYRAAVCAADAVTEMMRIAAEARPDLKIDLFGHSLGARVAFLALRRAAAEGWEHRIGRVLALGAAEYRDIALRAALCCRPGGPEVISFMSRANDPYDAVLQLLGPRSPYASRARPLGASGLGRRAPGWIDIQLDHPDQRAWLCREGVAASGAGRFCRHNAFYARKGIAAFYRRLIDEKWTIEDLRARGAQDAIEPRWARFAPVRRRDLPTPRSLGRLRPHSVSIC